MTSAASEPRPHEHKLEPQSIKKILLMEIDDESLDATGPQFAVIEYACMEDDGGDTNCGYCENRLIKVEQP